MSPNLRCSQVQSERIVISGPNAWEQRKFCDSFVFLQNNTLSRDDLSTEGSAENVHYGDILIRFGECLDVQKEVLPCITSKELIHKFKASYLQNGDIVIADTAEDETVGKCSEIMNVGSKPIISGLHTMPCRPKDRYAPGYLGYHMNSASYHNQLIPLMQGTKVTSISKSAIADTLLTCPVSYEEQDMISKILQSLDNLITLHQRFSFLRLCFILKRYTAICMSIGGCYE